MKWDQTLRSEDWTFSLSNQPLFNLDQDRINNCLLLTDHGMSSLLPKSSPLQASQDSQSSCVLVLVSRYNTLLLALVEWCWLWFYCSREMWGIQLMADTKRVHNQNNLFVELWKQGCVFFSFHPWAQYLFNYQVQYMVFLQYKWYKLFKP